MEPIKSVTDLKRSFQKLPGIGEKTAERLAYASLRFKKEELDERLASVIIQFKARPGQIVLMADPQAPAGEMIYLVDAVRQHGGEKLHVATSPRVEK